MNCRNSGAHAGELARRQRVHVIERRRDKVAVAREILTRHRVRTTQMALTTDTPFGTPVEPEV